MTNVFSDMGEEEKQEQEQKKRFDDNLNKQVQQTIEGEGKATLTDHGHSI